MIEWSLREAIKNLFRCKHVTGTYPKGKCLKCGKEVDLTPKWVGKWKKL